jgi:hypothetical protein
MGSTDILERIALAGIRLAVLDDGRLWAEPAASLTDELRNLIRANKPALLELLTANEPAPVGPRLDDLEGPGRSAGWRIYRALLSPRQEPPQEGTREARREPRSDDCRDGGTAALWNASDRFSD